MDARVLVAPSDKKDTHISIRNKNKLRSKDEHLEIWLKDRNKTGNEFDLEEHNK